MYSLTKSKVAILVAAAIGLSACSSEKSPQELVLEAQNALASDQQAAAIISLKNAIRIEPNNATARYLLGKAYLDSGSYTKADKELERAYQLLYDKEQLLPNLVKVKYHLNEYDRLYQLIRDNSQISDNNFIIMLTYAGIAAIQNSEMDVAADYFAQASAISEESQYSQLGQAYMVANKPNGLNEAISLVDNILSDGNKVAEALFLKALLHLSKDDYTPAIEAFKHYRELQPNDLKARLYLATSYIRNEQLEEAKEHLDILIANAPEHPYINQLVGFSHYRKGDFKSALTHTEKALQNGLETPANFLLAGLSAFKEENYELAYNYLRKAVPVLANDHPARKAFAMTQIKLGYTEEMAETLDNISDVSQEDVYLFTTASFKLLEEGRYEDVKALIKKTESLNSADPQELTQLGVLKLSVQDVEGITDLEKVLALSPESEDAKYALASGYIQLKQFDKATELATTWRQEEPENLRPINLLASIETVQGNIEKANEYNELALTIDPKNSVALTQLANFYLTEKNPKKALSYLETLIDVTPDNFFTLTSYFRAHAQNKTPDKAIERMKSSFDNNSDNIQYRVLYARMLFAVNRFKHVIDLLEPYKTNDTNPALFWMLLGDSYSKGGQYDDALAVFEKLLRQEPQNDYAATRKLQILEQRQDLAESLVTVNRFISNKPESVHFKIVQINMLILDQQFAKAQENLNALPEKAKELPIVQGLQGQLWLKEGHYQKSLPGLNAQYEIQQSTRNAALLHYALMSLERESEAITFMNDHVTNNPNDLVAATILAEQVLESDRALAKKLYTHMLSKRPEQSIWLNNLAWIEFKLNNLEVADELASKAISLNSTHPELLSTAGLIKQAMGQKSDATALFEKAHNLAPTNERIKQYYLEAKGLN